MVRWPGIEPSSPGDWAAVCTTGSGAAGAVRPVLSSLVQSSTSGPESYAVSGPPSANSNPPREHRSVRHFCSVVRHPSITWKP